MSGLIAPGATIGILGGGQLGRMLALSARQLGYRVWLFAPEYEAPARGVADRTFTHEWNDAEALDEFAAGVAVATFEFENVPEESGRRLLQQTVVRPHPEILAMSQERRREKTWLAEHGFPVAPFRIVERAEDLDAAAEAVGFPAILKTARYGYDGKGQVRVRDRQSLGQAFSALREVPCVLEKVIAFEAEGSVIVARRPGGETVVYGPMLNEHVNHILDVTLHPAGWPSGIAHAARDLGRRLAAAIRLEGLLCVELFLTREGELIVNEIAPRPHNSGHWTMDGAVTSQFEQQIRAIVDLPLGSIDAAPAVGMVNLLGDLWSLGSPQFASALDDPEVRLHLYGKGEARAGRKMGHMNLVGLELGTVRARLLEARERFRGRA